MAVLFVFMVVLPVIADEYVSGAVDGRWTLQNSPYRVIGNIALPEGEVLIIEPGVSVLFEGNFAFDVHGLLVAMGGGEDNQRVRFGTVGSIVWRGLFFYPEADARSILQNCDITNAYVGIDINRSYLQIIGCRIDAKNIAINCLGANPAINDNILIRAFGVGSFTEIKAIWLRSASNPQIIGNQLIEARAQGGGEAFGIYVSESSPIIRENWIEVTSDEGAYGVFISRTAKLDIVYNVIRVNSSIIERIIWASASTSVRIINNTLHLLATSQNAIGLLIADGSEVTILNNIVIGNGSSTGDNTASGRIHHTSGWNDYWLHIRNHVGEWDGGEDEINLDPYFENFSVNINEVDYRLRWDDFPHGRRSPCIDAGTPELRDPNGTASDIGRFYKHYDPTSVKRLEEPISDYGLLISYPNPFNASTNIIFDQNTSETTRIAIFDVSGRWLQDIQAGWMVAGRHQVNWTPNGVSGGIYLIRIESASETRSMRVNYLP